MSKIPVNSKSPKSSASVAVVTNNDVSDDEDSLTNKAPINPDVEIGRLKKLVSDKTKQISDLYVLMETIQTVPGVNIEKYRKMISSSNDTNNAMIAEEELKDAKIVSLSKKVTQLQIQINKLNSIIENNQQEKDALIRKEENLAIKLKLFQAENRSEIEKNLLTDLQNSNKNLDECKRKNDQLKDELKNLQRVLREELGDGVTIDKALSVDDENR